MHVLKWYVRTVFQMFNFIWLIAQVNVIVQGGSDEQYEGATVIEPKKGFRIVLYPK